jgi:hypothetical protein
MASNLAAFGLPERLHCSLGVRRTASGSATVEAAAQNICEFFFGELVDPAGNPACALVRFYITQPFAGLPAELQESARAAAAETRIGGATRCLTLLGTAGVEERWNSRLSSRDHKAIPLVSTEMVEKAPMISQLIKAFGLNVSDVVGESGSIVRDLGGKTYGVFYVPDAGSSPYIPMRDEFVRPYSIKSVVGGGGALATGEMFALVVFARVHVTAEAAERFRALALDVKAALLRFSADEIFEPRTVEVGRTTG